MAKQADPQMITANRLRDGEVFPDPAAADSALEAAKVFVRDNVVVNPYLFDVRLQGGAIHPVKEREIIRADGPSVALHHGKQAGRAPHV